MAKKSIIKFFFFLFTFILSNNSYAQWSNPNNVNGNLAINGGFLNLGDFEVDPSGIPNGTIWYNTTSNTIKIKQNGTISEIGTGSISEGSAFTGGTSSRIIHTDVSGNLSTATPALGAGLTLSGALSVGTTLGVGGVATLTSMTMTGQLVFDGASVDVTTGTDQDFNITPNGTGTIILGKGVSLLGSLSSANSTSCITGLATGNLCLTDDIVAHNSGGNSQFATRSGSTASYAGIIFYNNASTSTGGIRYFDSAFSVAGLQNSIGLLSSNINAVNIGDSGADKSKTVTTVNFCDGSGCANSNAVIYGDGGFHIKTSSTIPAGDCDTDAKVGNTRRYAKDANNITLCTCQKRAGSYEWAAGPLGGDCT